MMLDPFSELTPYYFLTLGAVLPVFDEEADENAPDEYIILGEKNAYDVPAKCGYLEECQILVDVVVKNSGTGGKQARIYAGQVMALINRNIPIDLTSFQVVTTALRSRNSLKGLTSTNKINRVLLRFSHIVSQK